MEERYYSGQVLCLEYPQGHLKIPAGAVSFALVDDALSPSGKRILELSRISRVPIVICDEDRIIKAPR